MIRPTQSQAGEEMFSISDCQTTSQRKRFEEIAEELTGTDQAFIPPFPGSVAKYLSPKSAFCRKQGEIFPFIAWRDGKPVGRIAAIINRAHNAYHHDQAGFFGFFECEDNQETANALFAKAAETLRAKGCDQHARPLQPEHQRRVRSARRSL